LDKTVEKGKGTKTSSSARRIVDTTEEEGGGGGSFSRPKGGSSADLGGGGINGPGYASRETKGVHNLGVEKKFIFFDTEEVSYDLPSKKRKTKRRIPGKGGTG